MCVCVLHTVCWVHHQRMYMLYLVYVVMWNQTLYYLLLQIMICTTSAVSPTRRGVHEKTYGVRNRRRNVCAFLDVWMLWLGCLSITTVHGACVQSTRGYTRRIHLTFGEPSSSLSHHLSSSTSSISSTSDLASSVLSLILSKKLWTLIRPFPWR